MLHFLHVRTNDQGAGRDQRARKVGCRSPAPYAQSQKCDYRKAKSLVALNGFKSGGGIVLHRHQPAASVAVFGMTTGDAGRMTVFSTWSLLPNSFNVP